MRALSFVALAIFFAAANASASVQVEMVYEPGPKPVSYASANPWVPTGVGERTGPADCQANILEETLMEAKDGTAQSRVLREFFDRCEAKLARFGQHHMLSLLRLEKAQYRFLENPNIREVKFTITETLPSGAQQVEVIRGLTAIKPDAGPRPWMLVKCGLFCSLSSSTLFRNFLMHGFDESPFNMVVLNGNTGSEYYLDNHRVSMGGFDEGRQTMLIADFLRRESPMKDNISSLHLVGISKGGQAALFASAYNKYFQAGGKPPLDSVASLCPVVDLAPSLTYLFERSLARSLFYREFMDMVREVYDTVPSLQRYVDLARPPQPPEITAVVGNTSVDYYSQLPGDWSLAPFSGQTISDPAALWRMNNFSELSQTITTPTFVWSPTNDNIVNFADNGAKLEANAASHEPNPNLFQLSSPHGNHCGFSLAYGWDVVSAILRAHVLSHSPEFVASRQVNTQTLEVPAPALAENERHISQEWIASTGSSSLTLVYKIWKGGTEPTPAIRCVGDPFAGAELCYEKRSVTVPLASLPITGLTAPDSETGAETFTRWLNATVTILDANKLKLTDSTASPAFLRWTTYSP